MANFQIRDCTQDDCAGVVEVNNIIYPDRLKTVAILLDNDKTRKPKFKHRRWVATVDERIVGFGGYSQSAWDYHPQLFFVGVNVLPTFRRRGIGSALYAQVVMGLAEFDPTKLRAETFENLTDGIRFAEKQGFTVLLRESRSELSTAQFDPTPYAGLEDKLAAGGINIVTVSAMKDDPEHSRKQYQLEVELFRDVPGSEQVAWPDYEAWLTETANEAGALPDGYFIAVDEGAYVGLSFVMKDQASDALYQMLTGTRRAYRRRGIALALKIRGILYAKEHGYPLIKTTNALTNTPMLTLNRRLGFVALPDWIQVEKIIKEGKQPNG